MTYPPGKMFDRFRIDSILGEGASGTVYRAHDTKVGRAVALKVLRTGASEADRARLLREARLAARVAHVNVVTVYDVGEADGVPFIVMEVLSGRSLRAHMSDDHASFDLRVAWLMDLASALSAIHECGLVHRDLKPENVMIGDDGVLKLLDFGIARALTTAVDRAAVTQTLPPVVAVGSPASSAITEAGLVLGTPAYMAPEQMRGEYVDARADQFAWGVIAYEMLVGRRPWLADNMVELVVRMLAEAPAPYQAEPDERRLLERVVLRALAKHREERFDSMVELVQANRPLRRTSGLRGLLGLRTNRVRGVAIATLFAASVTITSVWKGCTKST